MFLYLSDYSNKTSFRSPIAKNDVSEIVPEIHVEQAHNLGKHAEKLKRLLLLSPPVTPS